MISEADAGFRTETPLPMPYRTFAQFDGTENEKPHPIRAHGPALWEYMHENR